MPIEPLDLDEQLRADSMNHFFKLPSNDDGKMQHSNETHNQIQNQQVELQQNSIQNMFSDDDEKMNTQDIDEENISDPGAELEDDELREDHEDHDNDERNQIDNDADIKKENLDTNQNTVSTTKRSPHNPEFDDLSPSRQFFFPLSKVKKITSFDPQTKGLTAEAKFCMSLACERFIAMMGGFVVHETKARGKKNIKLQDVADAIRANPQLEFLQFGMKKMIIEAQRQQIKAKELAVQRTIELAKRRKEK